jgi:hypothetical protein
LVGKWPRAFDDETIAKHCVGWELAFFDWRW